MMNSFNQQTKSNSLQTLSFRFDGSQQVYLLHVYNDTNVAAVKLSLLIRDSHLLLQDYAESEPNKVVVYITTLGVVRETFARCVKVRQILRTLLVKTEERDVFMSRENQIELVERMEQEEAVTVPQVFVKGRYLGVR